MMKLSNCWNLLPGEAMLMHNTRWENCFTIKWYMKRKQQSEITPTLRKQYFGQTCQGNQNYVKLISLISTK